MLRLTYERLRGFCEVCGMLTNDAGVCIIQNGGLGDNPDDNDDSSDDEEDKFQLVSNRRTVLTEIEDDDHNGDQPRSIIEKA